MNQIILLDVNGKTVHLVQRAPPSLLYQPNSSSSISSSSLNEPFNEANVFIGSFPIGNSRNIEGSQNMFARNIVNGDLNIQNMLQQIMSGFNESFNNSSNDNAVSFLFITALLLKNYDIFQKLYR